MRPDIRKLAEDETDAVHRKCVLAADFQPSTLLTRIDARHPRAYVVVDHQIMQSTTHSTSNRSLPSSR